MDFKLTDLMKSLSLSDQQKVPKAIPEKLEPWCGMVSLSPLVTKTRQSFTDAMNLEFIKRNVALSHLRIQTVAVYLGTTQDGKTKKQGWSFEFNIVDVIHKWSFSPGALWDAFSTSCAFAKQYGTTDIVVDFVNVVFSERRFGESDV